MNKEGTRLRLVAWQLLNPWISWNSLLAPAHLAACQTFSSLSKFLPLARGDFQSVWSGLKLRIQVQAFPFCPHLQSLNFSYEELLIEPKPHRPNCSLAINSSIDLQLTAPSSTLFPSSQPESTKLQSFGRGSAMFTSNRGLILRHFHS